ncbi:MAG: 4'-phosphopantetheinyl transferase superfamily protein, partial [Promethearchaeota archaeon]
ERQIISENDQLGTIYWTAKEAFSKAIGEGFHVNFRDIELKYNKKEKKFTLKLKNEASEFCEVLKNLQLNSEYTKKYVLSSCEIKSFKELPVLL